MITNFKKTGESSKQFDVCTKKVYQKKQFVLLCTFAVCIKFISPLNVIFYTIIKEIKIIKTVNKVLLLLYSVNTIPILTQLQMSFAFLSMTSTILRPECHYHTSIQLSKVFLPYQLLAVRGSCTDFHWTGQECEVLCVDGLTAGQSLTSVLQ